MRTSKNHDHIEAAIEMGVEYDQRDLENLAEALNISPAVTKYYANRKMDRVSRGVYKKRNDGIVSDSDNVTVLHTETVQSVYIPEKDETFVKWGYYNDVVKIIQTGMFYPMLITGLSGNGKTMMVSQACANLGREYIRVQISPETDEEDLIGGMRLVDGSTVFEKGPVVKAMEKGAVLLIDEIDRGTNKLMSLQGVLEGKPILLKKTGELITPAKGFTVIATGNTKGSGSDDGRYVSAAILDDAMLERFVINIDQPYPDHAIENNIVSNHMKKFGVDDNEFTKFLTVWSSSIRKSYYDGGIDDVISTRRLCHIVQTYAIFNDRVKSIDLCISRFDPEVKEAMIDLYNGIDKSGEENNGGSGSTGAW